MEETEPTEGRIEQSRRLAPAIESLLFVATEPVCEERLCEILGAERKAVSEAMEELRVRYSDGWGLTLIQVANGWRLETKPEHADFVTRLLSPQKRRFSRAALEVLAIVAYKQPVTQPEIEAISGVASDSPLTTLLEGNLVRPIGRKEGPGRPILYATTQAFLIEFGLNGPDDLPPIRPPQEDSDEKDAPPEAAQIEPAEYREDCGEGSGDDH
jgi:segregation and condensation protein B